jgi:hypothetical protein
LRRAGLPGVTLLIRHLCGDWGQVDPKRALVNRWAIAQVKDHPKPVISRFPLSAETRVWLITRHPHTPGRRQTTFILSREADTQPRPKAELVKARAARYRRKVRPLQKGRVK